VRNPSSRWEQRNGKFLPNGESYAGTVGSVGEGLNTWDFASVEEPAWRVKSGFGWVGWGVGGDEHIN